MITLFYGMLYGMLDPSEFGFKERIDPWYFAWTTMTSVGFGDFSPKTTRAKLLVMSQQTLLLFEITLLAVYAITKNKSMARI
jgi:voltage-gated potassium channel